MTIAEKIARAKADYDEVYEAGKKAEYDAFWDNYQNYGNRTRYVRGFYGEGWNDVTFNPKYDILIVGDGTTAFGASGIIDTKKTIDITKATSVVNIFADCYNLKTVRKLIVAETTPLTTNMFSWDTNLETLIVEGTIGQNGLNLQHSTKLSKESITSIINCLSTTKSGLSVTLSKTAVENAFEGGSTGDEWLNLIATKNNWTITLV